MNLGDLLAEDRTTLGTWNQIAAPEILDILGTNGFDYAVIDCEHGPFGIETAERQGRACRAAGIAPAVRVSRNDPVEIMRALDAGLPHVIVPSIGDREATARAVAATRFAPRGLRGACPCVRSAGHFTQDWPGYARAEEVWTGIIALVETAEGVRNFAGIAATEGLAGVMFGPFDLAVSMGLDGDWRATSVRSALEDMTARAHDAGLATLMPVFSPDPAECADLIEGWRMRGVRSFLIGSDKIVLASAFSNWSAISHRPGS